MKIEKGGEEPSRSQLAGQAAQVVTQAGERARRGRARVVRSFGTDFNFISGHRRLSAIARDSAYELFSWLRADKHGPARRFLTRSKLLHVL